MMQTKEPCRQKAREEQTSPAVRLVLDEDLPPSVPKLNPFQIKQSSANDENVLIKWCAYACARMPEEGASASRSRLLDHIFASAYRSLADSGSSSRGDSRRQRA